MLHRAVFLDKDGTLLEDVPYNVDPGRIRLMSGAARGLQLLHGGGYRLFIVSNQSGIARGFFTEAALAVVRGRLEEIFSELGVPLHGFYWCPHHPDGCVPGYTAGCSCRKPAPGMLLRAAKEHAIDLSLSWLIGDILDDVEAGYRAGCRTVLLDNGHETEWTVTPERQPDALAADLSEAARHILQAELKASRGNSRFASAGGSR